MATGFIAGGVNPGLLICDGNSLTFGTNSSAGNDYPSQLLRSLTSYPWRLLNNGSPGQDTVGMDTQASTAGPNTTDANLGTHPKTVVIGWEITNDIINNNPGAALGYSRIVAFFTHRRAANAAARLIILTCLPRVNIANQEETDRQTINANIAANWATFADGMVDVASDSHLNNSANLTYYSSDGIHLTDAGYAVVASLIKPVIVGFG